MLRQVDFVAYHDLQAQAAESIYEEMSKYFECKWKIGPNQEPSGAEIGILLDHTGFQPKVRKGKSGYKYLFHVSHDLGDVEIYNNEYDRLKEFDIIFAPSLIHYKLAKERLATKAIVLQTGWAKYDNMHFIEDEFDLEKKIKILPYDHTILYAPSFAWTYEWLDLFPLFQKLQCNIIIKNHIYVNSQQSFPKGQELEYKQHLESADKMESVVLETNTPNLLVVPRKTNICKLFPYVDVLITDRSSVALEFAPFGISIETGRYKLNEKDLFPECSRMSEDVLFLSKVKLFEVLGSIDSFHEYMISEKLKKNALSINKISKVSVAKLTTKLIINYLHEKDVSMKNINIFRKLVEWISNDSVIENKMIGIRALLIEELTINNGL